MWMGSLWAGQRCFSEEERWKTYSGVGGERGGRASSDWAAGLERGILRGRREGAEDSSLLSVHPIRSSFNKHWQVGCGDGGPAG